MQALDVFKQIQQHAEAQKNGSERKINPVVGQYYPQGDLNFWPLSQVPETAIPAPAVAQLAPGNSRGSRHCIADSCLNLVEFYSLPNPNELQGPILRLLGLTRITHPEHGDHLYPAGTILAVTYQRRYANDLKRMQD